MSVTTSSPAGFSITGASASGTYATTPFTDSERVDVRRFCGYPVYGSGDTSFETWRFFQVYGELEFKLTNLAPNEYQVVRQFLAWLYPLETAVYGTSQQLGTESAAVWTRNPREVRDRVILLNATRRNLCRFLGSPPGPELDGSSGGGGRERVI